MTKQLLFICLLTLTLKGYSQTEKNKINNIGNINSNNLE